MKKRSIKDFNTKPLINIDLKGLEHLPIYDSDLGYGCVESAHDIVERNVELSDLENVKNGLKIKSNPEIDYYLKHSDGHELTYEQSYNYNHKGLIFKVDIKPGIYQIQLHFTDISDNKPLIGISGLDSTRISLSGYFNAERTLPRVQGHQWEEAMWSYIFVNGQEQIHIEIEPRYKDEAYILESIQVFECQPIPDKESNQNSIAQIFLLGDSTVKTYAFQELPMNGWGQHFDKAFDSSMVDVINYSEGGRSLKRNYVEGRFNELLIDSNPGDYIFLQSGHNDEKEDVIGNENEGPGSRFGRGATEEDYERLLMDVYLPLIKVCQLKPVFVTPMARIEDGLKEGDQVGDSFVKNNYPKRMMNIGDENNIPYIDLNRKSIEYLNSLGIFAGASITMHMEAGESPGILGGNSFANGNANSKADGAHYKESLAKQYALILFKELYKQKDDHPFTNELVSFFKESVRSLFADQRYLDFYPELPLDCIGGTNGKYRNQIEKMVQIGALELDEKHWFNPNLIISLEEFVKGLEVISDGEFDYNYFISECIDFEDTESSLNTENDSKNMGYNSLSHENMIQLLAEFYKQVIKAKEPIPFMVEGYYPIHEFSEILDLDELDSKYLEAAKIVWEKGLFRSEVDVFRGLKRHGLYIEPKRKVTREKAAKYLYFIWALIQDNGKLSHLIDSKPKEKNDNIDWDELDYLGDNPFPRWG